LSPQRIWFGVVTLLAGLVLTGCQGANSSSSPVRSGPLKVVVVTGGHTFEEGPFRAMFASFKGLDVKYAPQRDDSEIFEDITAWNYDVIVLYNMSQKISPQRQQNFRQLLQKGVGLVVLHHALAAFQDWDGYADIIGGRYFLSDRVYKGKKYSTGTYEHDEWIKVHVADRQHPVTQGVSDFETLDEVYKGYFVAPGNHVLLQTDNPLSETAIGWVSHGTPGRVVYLELGHDGRAYGNPSFRRLVRQAIGWCAKEGQS
jgi:type 1 glutamine amidotransferase